MTGRYPSIWSRARRPIPLTGRRSRTIPHPATRRAPLEKWWTVRNCTGNRQQPKRSAGNSAEPIGRARRRQAAHPPDCSFPRQTGRCRNCKGPFASRIRRRTGWTRQRLLFRPNRHPPSIPIRCPAPSRRRAPPSTARSGRWSRKIPASSRATWENAALRRLWATETAVSRTGGRNAS